MWSRKGIFLALETSPPMLSRLASADSLIGHPASGSQRGGGDVRVGVQVRVPPPGPPPPAPPGCGVAMVSSSTEARGPLLGSNNCYGLAPASRGGNGCLLLLALQCGNIPFGLPKFPHTLINNASSSNLFSASILTQQGPPLGWCVSVPGTWLGKQSHLDFSPHSYFGQVSLRSWGCMWWPRHAASFQAGCDLTWARLSEGRQPLYGGDGRRGDWAAPSAPENVRLATPGWRRYRY